MKRRTKLILLMTVLLTLGGIGAVLNKIQHNAGVPFPGAIVVLDDASWRSRYVEYEGDVWYFWATPHTLLYHQMIAGKLHVIRRQMTPKGKVSSPEVLPIILKQEQSVSSLSPDGQLLCLWQYSSPSRFKHILVRTDGKGKPVIIDSSVSRLYWSPDSKSLSGTPTDEAQHFVECYDAHTGRATKTPLHTTQSVHLDCLTPEGKLLALTSSGDVVPPLQTWEWKITEVRGTKIFVTTYRKNDISPYTPMTLSPDGKRILWRIDGEDNTLLEKWQQKVFGRKTLPRKMTRWRVSHIDGNNDQWIGMTPQEERLSNELRPNWTPDSKGVHFLHHKKLWYLAVP